MIAIWFLISALLLEVIYIGLFILTIKMPAFRFWPPPTARSWQFFMAWIVVAIVAILFFLLGLFDYDSFILPGFWIRLPFTLAFFIIGGAIGSWASLSFPIRATIGLGDKLVTGGPYRFSRNPQYIGDVLLIISYFLLTNSWMVGVIGFLGVVLNVLAPFTEEPWLEQRFGEAYLNYKRQVPRFIGRRNLDTA
jgi:protein-S-isoprenylcysteine O-methyltransferase Ste14